MSQTQHYKTKDGSHVFTFRFDWTGEYYEIYCLHRPSLNGHDPSVVKTHLYDSGLICFVSGKEPRSGSEAQRLIAMWAEYFAEYCRTGIAKG